MAVSTVPQLMEGQAARLDVGVSVPCRVIGFSASNVVLALLADLPEEMDPDTVAYLLVDTGESLQAVRGHIATPAGREIVLQLSDEIRLGQRRVFSRAPLNLPTVLRRPGRGTWETLTRDVSAGGVRLARPPGPDPGLGEIDLELVVGEHRVRGQADVVRSTPHDLGLRFVDIDREDRLLLAALTLAYHRRA
jgi:PilZ domain